MDCLLTHKSGKFIWLGGYATKDIPKKAGFRWNPNQRHWATKDVKVAARLCDYADEDAKGFLEETHKKFETSKQQSRAAVSTFDVPSPDGLAYRPFQKAGVAYSLGREGTLIADEMGLGKTIQAIGVINSNQDIKKILVVCPASLTLNWKKELTRWLVSSRKIEVVGKTWPKADIFISSYNQVTKHQDFVKSQEWDLIVLDEAHYCKNPKAARTKALLGAWDKDPEKVVAPVQAKRRLALTGTPILNRPIEIQKVLEWLDPTNWTGFFQFAKRYCNATQVHIGRGNYAWDFTGASNLEELQERLRETVMIRRLKKDVLTELSPKQRQVVVMSGAKNAVKSENKVWDQHQEQISQAKLRVELSKASDDPKDHEEAIQNLSEYLEVAFVEMAKARHKTALAKLPMAVEHLKNMLESGEKIVIFAHHIDVVQTLMEELAEYNPVKIVGGMTNSDKEVAKDTFQTDSECKVIVGSLGAMREGHTLTASSNVVFVELDWVPANISQAEDRCHRIGQTQVVNVQHLVLDGSIDCKIAEMVVEKQEIMDKALNNEMAVEGTIPVIPDTNTGAALPSHKEVQDKFSALSDADVVTIHNAIRVISGYCDGAVQLDGSGFNKFDAKFGHHLADLSDLTPKQAFLGLSMVWKYKRQLDSSVVSTIDSIKSKVYPHQEK